MASEVSSHKMDAPKSDSRRETPSGNFLYNFLVSTICIPAIRSFFAKFLSKSSERLLVQIPCVSYHSEFGNVAEANNNNGPSKPVLFTIHNPLHFCWLLLLDPKMGLGETYMADDWSCSPNPTEFLRLLIRSKRQTTAANKAKYGDKPREKTLFEKAGQFGLDFVRKIAKVVNYMQHWLLENTLAQSTKNIQAHYDLGNDMFKLFLDKSMTYSCALFDEVKPVSDVDFVELEKAQYKKIDRLIDQLELTAKDHVLEIGCGWGAAAIRAVQRSGCKWTGITISREQLEWGQKKVVEAGLEGKIDLKFQDYRLVGEKYTRVLSVEMIEAVGEKYLPQYFQIINDVLENGGIAALQAIICPDAYYDQYRSSSDFIKKYIFPGGHLPSLGAISQSLPPTLKQTAIFSMGHHYSMTLEHWFFAWMNAQKEIETRFQLPADFHRRWQFYFCLCAALFSYDHIDVVQLTFKKDKTA